MTRIRYSLVMSSEVETSLISILVMARETNDEARDRRKTKQIRKNKGCGRVCTSPERFPGSLDVELVGNSSDLTVRCCDRGSKSKRG